MIGTGWPERDPEPAGPAPNGLPYESVWDFPRPPRIETETRPVRVELGGELVAESGAKRLRAIHPATSGRRTSSTTPQATAAS